MSKRKVRNTLREAGAAMVELSIVLPLFLYLIVAVYNVGNSISQMTWVINTTYAGAIAGANSPNTSTVIRAAAIEARAENVANIIDAGSKKLTHRAYKGTYTAGNVGDPNSVRTVLARMSGEIHSIRGFVSLDNSLLSEIVGPVLVSDTPVSIGENFFESWGNAIPDAATNSLAFRTCTGAQTDSAENTPCAGGEMSFADPIEE